MDAGYLKLIERVKSGHVRKYWLDSGLLYAEGGRAFVPRDCYVDQVEAVLDHPLAEADRLD
ncbi:UNVERIFIED_CONTAM: hypothetical protein Slati_3044500 [Sesamum latifolium]|uniref:Uncharacterized protein n=1 Tax=Sesamum latifolium TaxID=2727402 RepID=A0AAW2USM1_9LAMI